MADGASPVVSPRGDPTRRDAVSEHDGAPPVTAREAVFQVRSVSKIHQMGDVQVHALRSIDRAASFRAKSL